MSKLQRFKKNKVNCTTPVSLTRPLDRGINSKKTIPLLKGSSDSLGVVSSHSDNDSLGVVVPQTKTTPVSLTRPLDRGIKNENQLDAKRINQNAIGNFGRINYNTNLNDRSKLMSRQMTKAEFHIWFNLLSKKQLNGYKFIKQKIIYNYILDFYCSELLLAIEIDGNTHSLEYDKVRDNFISCLGIKILRFTNQNVFDNLESVRQKILVNIQEYANT